MRNGQLAPSISDQERRIKSLSAKVQTANADCAAPSSEPIKCAVRARPARALKRRKHKAHRARASGAIARARETQSVPAARASGAGAQARKTQNAPRAARARPRASVRRRHSSGGSTKSAARCLHWRLPALAHTPAPPDASRFPDVRFLRLLSKFASVFSTEQTRTHLLCRWLARSKRHRRH